MLIRTADDVSQLVRDRRKQLALSQAELARRAGVSRQFIVDLEQGKPTAEVGLVLKTLAATGLHLDAYDPHKRGEGAAGGASLLDAAREVLDQHRPAGMRPRTLSTRPARSAPKQTPATPVRDGSRTPDDEP